MHFGMHSYALYYSALAIVLGQSTASLLETLLTIPEISNFTNIIQPYVSDLRNFTLLAPSDEAIAAFRKTAGSAMLTNAADTAALVVSMASGGFSTLTTHYSRIIYSTVYIRISPKVTFFRLY